MLIGHLGTTGIQTTGAVFLDVESLVPGDAVMTFHLHLRVFDKARI